MKQKITAFSRLLIFTILLLLVSSAEKSEDLYKVLGLSKNASPAEIKKNFRKLAKKFHPDANKDRQSWAEKEFIKVNNAYEILSNPEKRKLYDLGGEEMVNNQGRAGQNGQGQGQQFQGGNMEDIINMMFGGGARRGGQQQGHQEFNFGFGGGQQQGRQQQGRQQQQEQEEPKKEKVNLIEVSLAIPLDESNMPDTQNLTENWNVFFYSDDSKNSPQAKWVKEFVEKFGMHLKIGFINCSKSAALCEKFNARKTPEFYIFYQNNKRLKVDLIEGLPLQFLVQQNIDLMTKNVVKVTFANYIDFIKSHFSQPIILSFTERKSSSILLLSIGQLLKEKVVIAEIQKGDPLCTKFKINSFPALLALDDALIYSGTLFNGPVKREPIIYWIQETAMNKKHNTESRVKEFNKERAKIGHCGETDNNFCFISVVDSSPTHLLEYKAVLEKLSEKYSQDGIQFYFILASRLNKDEWVRAFDKYSVLIIRGKRKRFTGFEEDLLHKSIEELDSKLENMLSGGGSQMKSFKDINALVN